jgi:Domain of unknown function (DUF4167)
MTLGQTDRFRDRQTNRRREPNPLTRSYDSRGPDVRIRGTALHVAERYLQLARDANTASNPVAAENYLQHAEHYFRLMATAQAEQLEGQTSDVRATGQSGDVRATRQSAPEDFADSCDFGYLPDRFASPGQQARQAFSNRTNGAAPVTPQPYAQRQRWVGRKV